MTIDSVLHTNRHSIDRVLNAGLPVALVFWDRDRSPVKANDDELERLASKYAGRALIARIDAEEEAELLGRFDVDDVPSFVFIEDGNTIERTPVDEPGYVDAWLNHLTAGGPKPAQRSKANGQSGANGSQPHAAADTTNGASTGGKPVTMTDANFRNITSSAQPVLVDFWAEWCGPCRMVAPTIEALAKEFDGRAVVGKLNVEENQATAGQYGVRSIPTMLIFKNGQVVDQIVGAQPLPVLRQRLSAHA